MLPINPENICFLIEKAREFQAKEQVVIPEKPLNPTDNWALQTLADHIDDPTYQEFKLTVDDLEPDQQQALVALMWIGRGDFTLTEWPIALANAKLEKTIPTADYLLSTPLVADYLEEGLDQCGYSCNDL